MVRKLLLSDFVNEFLSLFTTYTILFLINCIYVILTICHAGSALQEGHPSRGFFEKACLKLLKTLVDVQTVHPYTFIDDTILPRLLQLCYWLITEPQNYADSFEQLLIYSMIFIQTVIQCKEYTVMGTGRVLGQTSPTIQEAKESLARKAEGILKSLLDDQHVLLLCDILVRRLDSYITFS